MGMSLNPERRPRAAGQQKKLESSSKIEGSQKMSGSSNIGQQRKRAFKPQK